MVSKTIRWGSSPYWVAKFYVEHVVVVATQIVILLVWVRFPLFNPYGISIMDNTVGFYPTNVGSIPACRTRVMWVCTEWLGSRLQI